MWQETWSGRFWRSSVAEKGPANKLAPKWTNNVRLPQPNSSYGYNMAGSGRYPAPGPSLGLDGGSNNRGTSTYLSENQVKVPSDMIAVADIKLKPVGADNDLDDIFPINLLAELAPRHNKGENIVFCDGHVEYAKHMVWLKKTEVARQRWNNDNQPHRETWPNNPLNARTRRREHIRVALNKASDPAINSH